MSKRNESIGAVECPVKGCTEQCDVFRFRERGESEKSVANRRFAGKLYGRCSRHGRFGGDAGDSDMQEYILCNANMKSPGDDRRSPAKSPAKSVAAPAISPARSPAKAPAKQTDMQTPIQTQTPAKPPASSSESPAAAAPWGFFL